jgi:hypothetical protein
MERSLAAFAFVGGLWTPAQLASTACWLDAADESTVARSGNSVSQWQDKSGNARHANQTTPANQPTYISSGLNSLGLIDWDGSNDAMTIDGGATPLHSALSANNTYSMAWVLKADTVGNAAVMLYVPESTWEFLVELKEDGGLYWGDIPSNYRIYSGGSFAVPGYGSFFTLIKTAPTVGTAHVAGTLKSSYGGNDFIATPAMTSPFILGQYPGIHYDGKIAEIVISTYSWDTSERQLIEGYLGHKWGLQANLPNDHPYKNAAP